MREREYRAHLRGRIGDPSINSYIAYARRLERDLTLDLDTCELGDAAISNMTQELARKAVAPRSINNMMSVARSYREFCRSSSMDQVTTAAPVSTRRPRGAWP